MAINNTNTVATKLGLDATSSYIRLQIYLGTGTEVQIDFHVYTDKAAYLAGKSIINSMLEFDFSKYNTDIALASDVNLDNLHDLAIAELVARGMDNAKLAKTDLV
jgi:hypothetical protein